MVAYTFTPEELDLTIEALAYRMSRRKSEARFYPERRKHFRECEDRLRAVYQKLVEHRDNRRAV